jgi:hypothetical protein
MARLILATFSESLIDERPEELAAQRDADRIEPLSAR